MVSKDNGNGNKMLLLKNLTFGSSQVLLLINTTIAIKAHKMLTSEK